LAGGRITGRGGENGGQSPDDTAGGEHNQGRPLEFSRVSLLIVRRIRAEERVHHWELQIMNFKQLVEALELSQQENVVQIVDDIKGMGMFFSVPEDVIYAVLDEAGQDALNGIKNQQQLGLFVLEKLIELHPLYSTLGDTFRDAMERAGEGDSTAYLADFHVLVGLIDKCAAMEDEGTQSKPKSQDPLIYLTGNDTVH